MRKTILGNFLFLLSVACLADSIAVYGIENEKLTLSYRDDQHLRLDRSSWGYFVINGSKQVGVLKQGEFNLVLDANQMAAALGSLGGESISIPDSGDVRLTDTGKFREIAGFRGKVFEISDGSGDYRVVLSNHPRVVAASDAFRHFIRLFATAMGNEQGKRILSLDSAFRDHPYRGLLQVQGGMTLLSLTEMQKPKTFYQIPQSSWDFSFPGKAP